MKLSLKIALSSIFLAFLVSVAFGYVSYSHINSVLTYEARKIDNPEITEYTVLELERVKERIAILSIFIIALASIIGVIFGNITIFSIRKLHKVAQEVSRGNFKLRSEVKSKDEIGLLSEVFNKMLDKIEERNREVLQSSKGLEKKARDLKRVEMAMINILEDVQESEKMVKDERDRSNAIISSVGDGLVVVDNNYKIIEINKRGEELLGLQKISYKEKPYSQFWKLYKGDQEVSENNRPFVKVFGQGTSYIIRMKDDFYIQGMNNFRFPVESITTPLFSGHKVVGGVMVFRDASAQKELDRAKTEFVSIASHQLRTPLTAIKWYAEMLMSGDAGTMSEDQKQYLGEIISSNERMIELVRELLNVSRIELGTFMVEPTLIDIRELIRSVISDNIANITKKKIEIKEEYDESIPKVKLDQRLIRIVLQNLISNAVKYSHDNGEVNIKVTKEGIDFLFKISDNGMGIPENAKPKIFTKLYRADNARDKIADGNGLGLYIIKSIIENAGGKIWFESQENVGTAFYFTLPLEGMKKRQGTKPLDA